MPSVHFDWDELEDNIDEEYADSGSTLADYVTMPSIYGDIICQYRNGELRFRHSDGIGSTSELTNEAQVVTDTRAYRAFGVVSETSGFTNVAYQFIGSSGYYFDSPFVYIRRRYYDSICGRWLAKDPSDHWTTMLNLYQYAHNSPVAYIDPSGEEILNLAACGICLALLGIDPALFVEIGNDNGWDWGRMKRDPRYPVGVCLGFTGGTACAACLILIFAPGV